MDIIIEVQELSKVFKSETVFKNINLNLQRGKCYGFVGTNGSGKSVFFKLLCGLLLPTTGTIKVEGRTLGKEHDFIDNAGVVLDSTGFVPEYSGLTNLYHLSKIRNKIGLSEIKEAMQRVGLDPELKRKVKNYSLGMKQRLCLAQAIMENPSILILDEPMNGLDKQGVALIRDLIQEEINSGTTVFLSSHIADDINILCEQVFEFDQGLLTPVVS